MLENYIRSNELFIKNCKNIWKVAKLLDQLRECGIEDIHEGCVIIADNNWKLWIRAVRESGLDGWSFYKELRCCYEMACDEYYGA